jgi:hypothetical protein
MALVQCLEVRLPGACLFPAWIHWFQLRSFRFAPVMGARGIAIDGLPE